MINRLAIAGIGFYQTRLSPRKGYRCAYSVLHGGTGCSGFAKHAIMDHGIWAAIAMSKQRMIACKDAATELNNGKPKKRNRSSLPSWCDVCGFALCAGSAGAADPSSSPAAADPYGCAPTDCALPDCTPDCDVCSCGG